MKEVGDVLSGFASASEGMQDARSDDRDVVDDDDVDDVGSDAGAGKADAMLQKGQGSEMLKRSFSDFIAVAGERDYLLVVGWLF